MAGREARIFAEGSCRWAIASGTGQAWQTASGAATGLVGYVSVGASFTQTRNVVGVKERGYPDHLKQAGREFVDYTITYKQAVTANYPPTSVTAAGASIPLLMMEIKHNTPELGASIGSTAQYHQLIGGAFKSQGWSEKEDGNEYQQVWTFTNVIGPTASGYLSTGNQ